MKGFDMEIWEKGHGIKGTRRCYEYTKRRDTRLY